MIFEMCLQIHVSFCAVTKPSDHVQKPAYHLAAALKFAAVMEQLKGVKPLRAIYPTFGALQLTNFEPLPNRKEGREEGEHFLGASLRATTPTLYAGLVQEHTVALGFCDTATNIL